MYPCLDKLRFSTTNHGKECLRVGQGCWNTQVTVGNLATVVGWSEDSCTVLPSLCITGIGSWGALSVLTVIQV